MKRVYVAFQYHREGATVYKDGEGCVYLKPHEHPLLAGKEFANPTELIQTILDNNNNVKAEPFTGEVIIQEVLTF